MTHQPPTARHPPPWWMETLEDTRARALARYEHYCAYKGRADEEALRQRDRLRKVVAGQLESTWYFTDPMPLIDPPQPPEYERRWRARLAEGMRAYEEWAAREKRA